MTGRGGLQLRTQEEGVVSPDHYSMRERKKAMGAEGGERPRQRWSRQAGGYQSEETAAHRQRHLLP